MTEDHLSIIDHHRARVRQATQTFQREQAKLFRDDDQPLYTDHQARLDALAENLDRVIGEAQAASNEARAAAYAIEEREESVDPLERLTEAEAGRAATRREFVKEDAASLPLPDLARRLREVLASNDRAGMYLWSRYADVRVKSLEGGPRLAGDDAKALGEITTAIREARERFVDKKALARAEDLREASAELWAEVVRNPVMQDRQTAAMRRSGRYGL